MMCRFGKVTLVLGLMVMTAGQVWAQSSVALTIDDNTETLSGSIRTLGPNFIIPPRPSTKLTSCSRS